MHLLNRLRAALPPPAGLFAWLLLAALLPPAQAAAPFPARIGARSYATPRGVFAVVTINDSPVATLRTPAAGLSPARRALAIKENLAKGVASGLVAAEVAAAPAAGTAWEVRGGGRSLLLVTTREARAQHQTARRLALLWAGNIKRGLDEPALTVAPRQVLLPLGGARTLDVGGASLPEAVTVSGGDGRVASAVFQAAARRLTVRGVGVGQTEISVQAGGVNLPVAVSVRRYAAFVLPRVTVRVTGRPEAPASLVQTAVYLGLKQALNGADGAQVRLLTTPRSAGPLRPGDSLSRRLSLRIAGPDLLPVVAAPLITVVNQPLPPDEARALFYSNNPEQVRESQTLFSAPLTLRRAVRLDYHHQNSSGGPLIFHADVVNASDKAASVHLISGVAEPEVDTVQVGRRAGAAFLSALDGGLGVVLNVPPHARVPLVVQPFGLHLTVSGILQMEQMDGPAGALSLSVVADGDRETLASSPLILARAIAQTDGADARLVAAPAAPLASGAARATSPFVFGPPRVALSGAYAAGGQWLHLRLGNAESLRNAAGTQTLWGNYGVSYFLTVRVSNPTSGPRVVGVFFAPEAGLAAGLFQVSGEPLLQFDPMPPPQEEQITRFSLAPGQAQTVRIRTILLNGSAYPASVVVHAL